MVKKRVKTMVSKNDPIAIVVPKRMNIAPFEPLLSRTHPLLQCVPHLLVKFPRRCSYAPRSKFLQHSIMVSGRVRVIELLN